MSYFITLTEAGEALIAAHLAGGPQVVIAQVAVGDGDGFEVTPDPEATALVNEVYRKNVDSLSVFSVPANQMQVEVILPTGVGGWWLREIGLFTVGGVLVAHGNMPTSYKPEPVEGASREMIIRAVFAVSHTSSIQLVIDPSLVYATQSWVLAFGYSTQTWVLQQLERNRPRRHFMCQI